MTKTQHRVMSVLERNWPYPVRKDAAAPIPPRAFEKAVQDLRLAGYHIASDAEGYWIARTSVELRKTAASLRRRFATQIRTVEALERCAAEMELEEMGAQRPSIWTDDAA